jgi:hypothetical protein
MSRRDPLVSVRQMLDHAREAVAMTSLKGIVNPVPLRRGHSFCQFRRFLNQSSLRRSPTFELSDPRPSKLTQDACRHPLTRAAGEKGRSSYVRFSVSNWYAIWHIRRATIVMAVFACLPRARCWR